MLPGSHCTRRQRPDEESLREQGCWGELAFLRHYSILLWQDDDRIKRIEDELKEARTKADNADKQYDEVSKKLQAIEADLERAEERGEMGETKIMELEEELKVIRMLAMMVVVMRMKMVVTLGAKNDYDYDSCTIQQCL